jgi:hypothetical protein
MLLIVMMDFVENLLGGKKNKEMLVMEFKGMFFNKLFLIAARC